jgi:hypothetical protein
VTGIDWEYKVETEKQEGHRMHDTEQRPIDFFFVQVFCCCCSTNEAQGVGVVVVLAASLEPSFVCLLFLLSFYYNLR